MLTLTKEPKCFLEAIDDESKIQVQALVADVSRNYQRLIEGKVLSPQAQEACTAFQQLYKELPELLAARIYYPNDCEHPRINAMRDVLHALNKIKALLYFRVSQSIIKNCAGTLTGHCST